MGNYLSHYAAFINDDEIFELLEEFRVDVQSQLNDVIYNSIINNPFIFIQ